MVKTVNIIFIKNVYFLYHAKQNAGKMLYICWYSTKPSHRSVQFNGITQPSHRVQH